MLNWYITVMYGSMISHITIEIPRSFDMVGDSTRNFKELRLMLTEYARLRKDWTGADKEMYLRYYDVYEVMSVSCLDVN